MDHDRAIEIVQSLADGGNRFRVDTAKPSLFMELFSLLAVI